MKPLLLTAILIFSSGALAADGSTNPTTASSSPAANQAVPSAASNELKVNVKGMVCAFCAQGIEKKFKAQSEVESVQVSLENKFVKLKFREGQKLSNEKISEILKSAGYEADFGG